MSNGRAPAGSQSKSDGSLPAAAKFVEAYQADPIDRIRRIKRGISADVLEQMAKDMSIPKARLAETLGVARATIERKAINRKIMSVAPPRFARPATHETGVK